MSAKHTDAEVLQAGLAALVLLFIWPLVRQAFPSAQSIGRPVYSISWPVRCYDVSLFPERMPCSISGILCDCKTWKGKARSDSEGKDCSQ